MDKSPDFATIGSIMARQSSERVRHGHVSLPVWKHAKGWRWAWKDPATGKWCYGTRKDRKEALTAAARQAARLATQHADLAAVLEDPAAVALIRRVLAMQVTHAELDHIEKQRHTQTYKFQEVAAAFLRAKEAAASLSTRNLEGLTYGIRNMLLYWTDREIGEITPEEIDLWIAGLPVEQYQLWKKSRVQPTYESKFAPKTRLQRRKMAVTVWRWAQEREYLPEGRKTAAEKSSPVIVVRETPATWTPAELRAMWEVCPPDYRPWLALACWAGIRTEEAYKRGPKSKKDVLRWKDVRQGYLEVRPEVGKTGATTGKRIIPLQPILAAFLAQERIRRAHEPDDAPICLGSQPGVGGRDTLSVTKILGGAVGGWRPNACRHSFISYRAAQVGLGKTAIEAGNSEAEAKRSYHDAMTEADAEAWFNAVDFGTPSEPLSEVEKITPIRIASIAK